MPAKKNKIDLEKLEGKALVKEVARRIRLARNRWKNHNNKACRAEREKAISMYEKLSAIEREQIPQELRIWLRYRTRKFDTG